MISAYVQRCEIDEASRLFEEMPERDSVSWTTMINGYVRIGKLDEARELLNEMPYRNIGAQTAMISGYIQCNKVDEARRFFDEIGTWDVVCWNAMIAGYAHHGRINEALCLSKRMVNKDMVTWNTMISCYAQVGQMDRAVKIFEEMGERDLVSWNSLIAGFMLNGQNLDALKSFALMGHEGKKPDQLSFACGLSSCATIAALQVGNQLHQVVVKGGYLNYLVVNNALITMYAKCGRILEAGLVFNGICHADVISWNSLIGGYAINGYGKEALKLFEEMASEGMAPDEVTFIGILSACNHAGMVDHGLKLFKCMSKVYAIEPLAEHYACMVDLLGRVGRLDEAFEIVRGMKVKATAGVWGALLGACRAHGNLELGRLAAHKLSEFEPHKTSNYVLLSNIHAEANRWNEVQEVRMLMNASSTVKEPGCSWVEVRNQVHGFLSDDSTRSRPDIGVTLASLNSHIRNAFHISEVSA
jgi:pentatricopeptide repeat protein